MYQIDKIVGGWTVYFEKFDDGPSLPTTFAVNLDAAFKLIRDHAALCEEKSNG